MWQSVWSGLPFVVYIALVRLPGQCIRRCGVPISGTRQVLLLSLFVHAINITDEVRNRRSCSPIGAAVGTLVPVLSTVPLLWTWFGNTLAGSLNRPKPKTLRSWLGLPLDLSFPLLSFQQWLSPNIWWKHGFLIWWNNNLPMDGYWMKAFLQSVLFPMCRYCHLVETNCYRSNWLHSILLLDLLK